ncbi:unnamed protein product [Owenia fusiformis]|uniref:Uncharacterized protein n=1 Tax=Owenia fusiformis TaxID=6347 RepID=A0A8J1XK23_OWEFU|nr:unnamed protein product [Owenia fusiformis]
MATTPYGLNTRKRKVHKRKKSKSANKPNIVARRKRTAASISKAKTQAFLIADTMTEFENEIPTKIGKGKRKSKKARVKLKNTEPECDINDSEECVQSEAIAVKQEYGEHTLDDSNSNQHSAGDNLSTQHYKPKTHTEAKSKTDGAKKAREYMARVRADPVLYEKYCMKERQRKKESRRQERNKLLLPGNEELLAQHRFKMRMRQKRSRQRNRTNDKKQRGRPRKDHLNVQKSASEDELQRKTDSTDKTIEYDETSAEVKIEPGELNDNNETTIKVEQQWSDDGSN